MAFGDRREPMRRGKPLQSGKGLAGGGELRRVTPMRRTAPAAKAKPAGRRSTGDSGEREARRIVAERSGGVCEMCGAARATNWHHRKNASQGGLWCPSNGLHLCGSGSTGDHGWVTEHPTQAHDDGGWVVWSHEDPAAVPVLVAGRGWVLLGADGSVESSDPIAA